MLLSGIFPAATTPFYSDGSIYFKKLEHNLDRYSKAPLAGVVILGSTGEAILLSDQERRDVLKCARGSVTPEKVLIAGVGHESARETIALSEHAATLGYDVAMVRTPHYYKAQMNPPQMLAFYRFVCDQSPLPVIIYNFPQATGYDIPAELVIELAGHPNLIGIKESSGNMEKVEKMVAGTRHIKRQVAVTEQQQAVTARLRSAPAAASAPTAEFVPAQAIGGAAVATAPPKVTLKTRQREVGFQVMVGSAQTLKESLDRGAVGAILAFADCAPTACFEIYAAWKDGDMALAGEKQARIKEAATTIVGKYTIPAIKYAMDLNGYYGGPPRLPLLPPDATIKADIERLMENIRN
jgi:dihydrodipicolinate synthase/N-acetylneuraminate lyase